MLAWWQMWKGVFSPEVCQRIIDQAVKLPAADGSVGFGSDNRKDRSFRRSVVRWINGRDPAWEWLHRDVSHYIRWANDNAFGFDLTHLRELQFTEYVASDKGHYDWHEDLHWRDMQRMMHRKLSFVLQLTDPASYNGGDLELRHEPPAASDLRTQGTVIVFPAFHPHRVSPLTSGRRYSLVAWHDGPKFR